MNKVFIAYVSRVWLATLRCKGSLSTGPIQYN